MPDDSYTVRMIRGTPAVATPEEIDVTSAEALRVELLALAECGHPVVAVDMTGAQLRPYPGQHAGSQASCDG